MARTANSLEAWQQVKTAAEKAAVLDIVDHSEAYYYQGLAEFRQSQLAGTKTTRTARLRAAAATFRKSLADNPDHVGAMLNLALIAFEGQLRDEPGVSMAEAQQLATEAVTKSRSKSQKAKAHYVRGVGFLAQALNTKDDETFLRCLAEINQAAKLDAAYQQHATAFFSRIDNWQFQSQEKRAEAQQLRD